MKRILSSILMITLFAVGVYLIFQPQINQMIAKFNTDKYKIANLSAEQIEQNSQEMDQRVEKSDQFLSKFSNQHNLAVTGLVSIPEVNINLPIFNSDSDDAILYGASNVRKTKMGEGNYSLASHYVFGDSKNDRLFTPLSKVKKGTRVYLTDKSKIYTYEIKEIFDVDQYAVQVLDNLKDRTTVTLITCADFNAEYRHIYRGDLIEVKEYNQSSDEIRKSFEKEFNL